jgi:hypothetical protein
MSTVGTYAIVPALTGAALGNYDVVMKNGTLTVTRANLTVTADNQQRVYGGSNPALTGTVVGVQAGDAIAASYSTTAVGASPVGTYAIVPALSGAALGNYDVVTKIGMLTVTRATLTVTADDRTRVYGGANPAFTATYAGFLNGDTAAVLSGAPALTTTAAAVDPVGTYVISAGAGTLAAENYTFVFKAGVLKVTYGICAVSDGARPANAGSTIPIKVQLCDAAGASVSSPAVTLRALGAALAGMPTLRPVAAAGNANPDNVFRLVGPHVSYMFNLQTKGLAPGAYELTFEAAGDPLTHSLPFEVK